MQQGACYMITCITCKLEGRDSRYFGETARTPYDRGLDHWNALENGNGESPLVEHHMEEHPDLPHNFVMEVKSFHERPLDRQVEEAELIGSFEGSLLNRRG